MPMPWTYRHSEREFKAFLQDARQRMELQSDNNTYTAVDGVLRAFRARLTPQQVVDFAQVLPSTLRAILIQDWDTTSPIVAWGSRGDQLADVQNLRLHHNLTPDTVIEATAWALRRHVRQIDLDRVLKSIGPQAEAFWHVDVDDPAELEQRIV
ncbi:uncharacterized protein (DUF2267 family) [Shimia isoporae]|uniref:Uncharacterized protein (DUF2267 family) n=1 Tax=Shimia isoporae TaxID=647720 RepID=A0A4V2Q3U6_9RHOB|nr:DUF2267 domain-containing protein [Shimia isoporae]TCL08580.1 uncharacterized protein (DUF2267 family) [Shimia isoporae]